MLKKDNDDSVIAAVREDRTPGGKHRVKKVRLEDGEYVGSFVSAMDSSVVTECCMTEEDEILIQQLVDAKPDIIPGHAGKCQPR